MNGIESGRAQFVNGNQRLDELLARPDIVAGLVEVELWSAAHDAGHGSPASEDLGEDGQGVV